MALQHLRSSTAHKRPIPTVMSAGQIAINTNEASPALFFKDSNGDLVKVGPVHIGTSAPNSSPASVAATALVTGTVYQILTVGDSDFTLVGASANTVGTIFTATGTTTGTGTVSGQQGVEKGEMWLDTTGGTYVLKIYDGSAWRSESGTFVDSAGDTMTGALGVVAGSASAPGVFFSGDTNTGLLAPAADSVAITTGGTQRIVVDSSGRLGLGTASPTQKVHIQDSSGPLLTFDDGTTQFGSLGSYNRLVGSGPIDTFLVSSTNGKSLVLRAPTSQTISFDIASSEAMRIDSSGNVGIGSSNPTSLGSGFTEVMISGNTEGAGLQLQDTDGNVKAGLFTSDNSNTATLRTITNHPLTFRTNNTERMRIDSSGRLLVGTTTEGAVNADTLTVAESGDSGITIRSGSASAGSLFFSDATSGTAEYAAYLQYDHSSNNLAIGTASTERMRIDSSGKVGIGTSTARAGLTVALGASTIPAAGASTAAALFGNELDDGTYGVIIGANGSGTGYLQAQRGDGNTTVYPLAIQPNGGNVGIGESSPAANLEITPGTGAGTLLLNNASGSTTDGALNIEVNSGGVLYETRKNGGLAHIWYTTGAETMRLDTAGRLLVGTSSASSSAPLIQAQGPSTGDSAGRIVLSRGSSGQGTSSGTKWGELQFENNGSLIAGRISCEVDAAVSAGESPGRLVFSTTADGASSPTERMRIGNTGRVNIFASEGNVTFIRSSTGAGTVDYAFGVAHSATNTSNGTISFAVFTNGNAVNTNNSYTAISDAKLKENIVGASSQWDDLKALQIRNYNFKEETGHQTHTQIGLVAQEVELVSPGLVSESSDRDEEGNDLGTVTKSVNYSVLYMKAVKALQEAMERIEVLEQRLNDAGIN